ncbi:TIGR00270 family protein [Candidatus Bathyarchaeota archaeon]|nr:TIGR00270 family protein [Candidatus Bathyarchaeota archaeon]
MVCCEVCGKPINGAPNRVIIAGAKLLVCSECVKLGSTTWEVKPEAPVSSKASLTPIRKFQSVDRKPRKIMIPEIEIVENYPTLIRKAREKQKLDHAELGKRIGEKISVIQKLETGRLIPDELLAKKLEHALRIKLLVPTMEPPVKSTPQPRELTLGDVVEIRKKEPSVKSIS